MEHLVERELGRLFFIFPSWALCSIPLDETGQSHLNRVSVGGHSCNVACESQC